jgi:small-conductance mechanosensitive channel
MTFQVSDTDQRVKGVRRVALRHALVSYVYGTVIVAITVSTVASLLGQRTLTLVPAREQTDEATARESV